MTLLQEAAKEAKPKKKQSNDDSDILDWGLQLDFNLRIPLRILRSWHDHVVFIYEYNNNTVTIINSTVVKLHVIDAAI